MVHFYNLSKKALIPRINITKSFKFLDMYVGSSIGYDLFFYNRNNFKFGLLSARLDFINTFMDIIIVHNQCKISNLDHGRIMKKSLLSSQLRFRY